jgi:4-amino-4-deoxy-L-arabinose transferase-like glycosyltransferase
MTEPFYITAILASVLIAVRLRDSISLQEKRTTILIYGSLLGLFLGLAVLLRQLFIILVPFLLFWIVYTSRPAKGRRLAAPILVSMAVIIAMILPFTIYNYSRFGHLVPLNSNAGYAFFLSNHPIHGNNFIAARDLYDYQELYPAELLDLDEAALDQALLGRGVRFVVEDPIRYVRLSLSRIPVYFNFWPLPGSDLISNITKITSFGIMLPFFILGLFKWVQSNSPIQIRNLAQNPGSLLLLIAFVYSLIHIMSWVQVRYRLPVDAMLLPFAAAGLGFALEKAREQFRPTRSADDKNANLIKAQSSTNDEY